MALYPYTIENNIPSGIVKLDPGSAAVVPFQLDAGGLLHLDLIQADREGRVQDFTIRAWISSIPMGNANPNLPTFVQSWQPNKIPNTIVACVYDQSERSADKPLAIPSDPGLYYLNVLNLTNQPNQFWLTLTPQP